MLHGDSAYVCMYVCMYVTLQECNYCKHISPERGIASVHIQWSFLQRGAAIKGGYVHSNTELVVAGHFLISFKRYTHTAALIPGHVVNFEFSERLGTRHAVYQTHMLLASPPSLLWMDSL